MTNSQTRPAQRPCKRMLGALGALRITTFLDGESIDNLRTK